MNWKFWKRPPAHPAVAAYLGATPTKPHRKARVADTRFVVLDSETSGFDIQNNRILSLATAGISGGRLALWHERRDAAHVDAPQPQPADWLSTSSNGRSAA